MTDKMQEALNKLKASPGESVLLPAITGSKLVKSGDAVKGERPANVPSTSRGYGWFKAA